MLNVRTCSLLSVFKEVTAHEIIEIVGRAPAKHCSLDPVPTSLVKRLLPLLANTLAKMVNTSLKEGVFPETLKHAIVRPSLKKLTLNPDDRNSYRPISNLSFVSKIVERVVVARFSEHAEAQHLFPSRQSAYRANHSTETAVLVVHDAIVRSIDSRNICALALLDLSAAFDTVDHDTLLSVLSRRFGVDGLALEWFGSYLAGRTQTFQYNAQKSGPHAVTCSVPQGSVLGPQEFIAYTEELEELIEQHLLSLQMYADDTQLIQHTSIADVGTTIHRLEQCIESIHQWCASMRLQLNPSKTEVIWFGTKASLKKMENMDLALHVGNDVIKPTSVVRDLGVLLDSELSMKKHIAKVASVCFYHLRRLKQVRRILGQQTTTSLVSAFVLSRLDYCNSVLAGLPKSSIAPLQRVQNAAARLICGLRSRDHVTPALSQLHWLPVAYRITYKLCILMHLVHVGRSPSYLADLVTAIAKIPSRARLRSAASHCYELPSTNLKFGERSFSYAGPAAWNTLPNIGLLHEQHWTLLLSNDL